VIVEPLAQASNLNGPVPMGFSLLPSARRRDDDCVAPAHVVEERALRVLERHLDGGRVDHLDRIDRAKRPFWALVESSARARSSENFTSSALKSAPS
jgi:hypothetical protein